MQSPTAPAAPEPKNVSVIIVTFQTGASLWLCLYRVLQMKSVHEIIVVNNGNEIDVELHLKKLEQKHSHFTLLTGQGNVGFATGCNLGAQKATGEYVVLLNPDSVPLERDMFERMVAVLEHPAAQLKPEMVGAVLRNEDGSEQRATRRNLMTPLNALQEGLGMTGIKLPLLSSEPLNITGPMPAEPHPIPAISGACMMMKRTRYVEMRGLDENYFLHVEDMDLCHRLHHAGGAIWLQPKANFLHFRSTSNVSSLFVERNKANSFYRYFRIHYYRNYISRYIVNAAVTLRLGAHIAGSFLSGEDARPLLRDSEGVRRVQAIVRGVNAALEDVRNNVPNPLHEGATVLITGASSAIGLFLIGRLLAHGCKVIALRHSKTIGFFHPNLTWVNGDLTNLDELQKKLESRKCHYAVHCAGIWHISGLAYMLKQMNVRHLVAFSSTSAEVKQGSSSAGEREVAEKLGAGEQALASEANAWGMSYTIIRPTMVYGAGLDENITRIANMIDAKKRFVLPKGAQGKRAPIHADDLAIAALGALKNPAAVGKTYTLQGGSVMPYGQMVEKVFQAMQLDVNITYIPGLEKICGILHRFSSKVPHPAVALRMQEDLIFPDNGATTELGITPRAFLAGGSRDLGLCDEEVCRSLLPA